MHVVIVSNCEKRALKRTRAVLDSYALRSGEHTWMTRITREGLDELRAMLRRSATRQTSVVCFRNDGLKAMKLLWIVGNKRNFDRHGVSPVATRKRTQRASLLPAWVKIGAALASAAGHLHDIGKFGVAFQEKLQSKQPVADAVRHEWISLLVARAMISGVSWDEAWGALDKPGQRYRNVAPFDASLNNPVDVVLFLIATHHRLPKKSGPTIGKTAHVRDENHIPKPCCRPSKDALDLLQCKIDKLRSMTNTGDALYWRALATVARMALILADHTVSAELHFHPNADAYANTDRASGKYNQSLEWHLKHVGFSAGDMLFNLLSLAPPALSQDAVDRIATPPRDQRFAWQEKAARALSESNRLGKTPHLVLNLAGTGTGKTRANVRAICALNEDGEVRLATALNLRTLTLQTGDAYAEQLGIGKDELACVIGDVIAKQLHEYRKAAARQKEPQELLADDDENPPENELEILSEFAYADAPPWLKHFSKQNARIGAIVGAPVLVSTIDFLIAAGDPYRQAHHALAAARLMSSDLVLDEIDGYDPKPLLAVLRLTTLAALFGRNVVASSATLSRPVAKLLWQAYATGAAMRARLNGQENPAGEFKTALIDDRIAPTVAAHADADAFIAVYAKHIDAMLATLQGERYRIPFLQTLAQKDTASWLDALRAAIVRLHSDRSWIDPTSGKRISIGLVRMANIAPAIRVARHLARALPQARVACYHSQHLAIQRFHIECRLDFLLRRNDGDAHLWADAEIRALLDAPDCTELMLIVVATPVEEIGRDHDFDWAVVDPSSSQSIVQTAGRVNRHRQKPIDAANIAIMQFNWKRVDDPNAKCVFQRPGCETASAYPSHDLGELLDWATIDRVDARLRFGQHRFAALDDASIAAITATPFADMNGNDAGKLLWMAHETYSKTPLREADSERADFALCDPEDSESFDVRRQDTRQNAIQIKLATVAPTPRAWLTLTDFAAAALADETNIPRTHALCASLELYSDGDGYCDMSKIVRDLSFGFYRQP